MTASDLQFSAEEMLRLVLDESQRVCLEAVRKLTDNPSAVPQGFKRVPPVITLFTLLQRDLFRKSPLFLFSSPSSFASASIPLPNSIKTMTKPQREQWRAAEQKRMLEAVMALATALIKNCQELLDVVLASDLMNKPQALESPLGVFLLNSLVGQALPLLLHFVYMVLFQSVVRARLTETLWTPLQTLLMGLDRINAKCFGESTKAAERQEVKSEPMPYSQTVVLESPHCYFSNTDEQQSVDLPGADYLCVEFDPRCSTERNRDFVELMNGHNEPVCDSLHGPSFPQLPLLVPGSQLKLRFHSDSTHAQRWGYRLLVTGMKLPAMPLHAPRRSQSPAELLAQANKLIAASAASSASSSGSSATAPKRGIDTARVHEALMTVVGQELDKPDVLPTFELTSSSSAASAAAAAAASASTPIPTTPSSTAPTLPPLCSLPWLLDVQNTVSRLIGKCARVLALGEGVEGEKAHRKWLGSALFNAGQEPEAKVEFKDYPADEAEAAEVKEVKEAKESKEEKDEKEAKDAAPFSDSPSASSASTFVAPKIPVITLSESGFLHDLMESTADSAAAALDAVMRKQLKTMPSDRMGGAVVKQTVRAFLCVLLKHLNLVTLAQHVSQQLKDKEAEATPASTTTTSSTTGKKTQTQTGVDAELLEVWRRSQALHAWIVSTKASYTTAHHAKLAELKASDKTLSATEAALLERRTTYEGFCEPILHKCLYLLSFRSCMGSGSGAVPAPSPRAASTSSAPAFLNPLSLSRSSSRGPSHPHDEEELPRDLLTLVRVNSLNQPSSQSSSNTYQTLLQMYAEVRRRRKLVEAEKGKEEAADDVPLPELLMQFVQSDLQLSQLAELIDLHNRRALSRSQILADVSSLLSSLTYRPASWGLLASWGPPFRAYTTYPKGFEDSFRVNEAAGSASGSHYLCQIESCSPSSRQQVSKSFRALYMQLTKLLANNNTPMQFKALILDSWAVDFLAFDHSFLFDSKILQTLKQLQQPGQQDPLLRDLSFVVQRFLMLQAFEGCFSVQENESKVVLSGASTSQFDSLQRFIIERVFGELESSVETMLTLRKQLSLQSDAASASLSDYLAAESTCFRHLSLFSSLARTPSASSSSPILIFLRQGPSLMLLLRLLRAGSPRQQGTVTRLLPFLLQQLSPSALDARKDQVKRGLGLPVQHDGDDSESDNENAMDDSEMDELIAPSSLPILKNLAAKTSDSEIFIRYLFVALGSCMVSHTHFDDAKEGTTQINSIDDRNGEVSLCLAADFVALLRTLLAFPTCVNNMAETERKTAQQWSAAVSAVLSDALQQLHAQVQPAFVASIPQLQPDHVILTALAALSVSGGFTDRLNEGSRVETQASGALKESGVMLELDRVSGKAKVLFDHNPNRVIECDISQLVAAVVPIDDSCLLPLSPQTLYLIKHFIEALLREEKDDDEREEKERSAEEQQKLAEELQAEQEKQLAEDVALASEILASEAEDFSCEVCTFLNAATRVACEMCGAPNPNPASAAKPAIKKPTTSAPSKPTVAAPAKKERPVVSTSALLYHQLRSRALKALCHVMQRPTHASALFQCGLLPYLLSMAVKPTDRHTQGFASVQSLADSEDRLLEMLQQSARGLVDNSIWFRHKQGKGSAAQQLSFSPFKSLQVHLPSALDVGSARGVQFNDEQLCLVSFQSAEDSSVGLVRSNFLVPNSLPAYYFEVTVNSLGLSRGTEMDWGVAVGLFRSGMPLKGEPGAYNSYAYSGLQGELHFTERAFTQRQQSIEQFSEGDVIGCGWNLRKNTIFFTKNGNLLSVSHPGSSSTSSSSKNAFENISGRFYPAIWIEGVGSQVLFNFGQREFLFDFNSTLPAGYLNQLSGETDQPALSAAEIRRRTMAEELMLMMGSFPMELCEIALERNGDDLQMAANWLIEVGYRELDRMANEAIRASQMEDEERKLKEAGAVTEQERKTDGDEEEEVEDLGDWLLSGGGGAAESQRNRRPAASEYLDDQIENEIPIGLERGDAEQQQQQQQQAPQQQQQPQPSSRSRNQRSSQPTLFDDLRVDDIALGQLLAVAESAPGMPTSPSSMPSSLSYLLRFHGCTGLVSAINVNTRCIQLVLMVPRLGWKQALWFPVTALCKPQKAWVDPCVQLKNRVVSGVLSSESSGLNHELWSELCYSYVTTERALSIRKVRMGLLDIISQGQATDATEATSSAASSSSSSNRQPLTLSLIGGASSLVDILKLAGSEYLSTVMGKNKMLENKENAALFLAFRKRLVELVDEDCKALAGKPLPPLRVSPSLYVDSEAETKEQPKTKSARLQRAKQRSQKLLSALSDTQPSSLVQLLIEECIVHFVQAVNHPPPVLLFQSQHPYESHSERRECVHIPGASKLMVSFDPQCDLGNDLLTRLCFYRDEQYQEVLFNYQRMQGSIPGFVVPGDRFWFKFTSGSNASQHSWGYRFRVRPVELRISDQQALQGLNFELGTWLLDLLLTQTPSFVRGQYLASLYDAIVWYVVHAKPSAKSRGVELLVRMLLHFRTLHNEHQSLTIAQPWSLVLPDLNKLNPLSQQIQRVMERMDDFKGEFQSPTLQGFVELLATADLLQAAFTDSEKKEEKEFKKEKPTKDSSVADRDIDISLLGALILNIRKATYGANESNEVDVTDILQRYVRNFGGSELVLPHKLEQLAHIDEVFSQDPAPRQKKTLAVEYDVMRYVFDSKTQSIVPTVVKSCEKSVSFNATGVAVVAPPPAPVEEEAPWSRLDRLLGVRREPQAPSRAKLPVTLARPELSMFDRVVELSRWTLSIQSTGKLPLECVLEARRNSALAQNHYPLPINYDYQESKGAYGAPDPTIAGSSYGISMWVYLEQDSSQTESERLEKEKKDKEKDAETAAQPLSVEVSSAKPEEKKFPRLLVHKGATFEPISPMNRNQRYGGASGFTLCLDRDDNRLVCTMYPSLQTLRTSAYVPLNTWTLVSFAVHSGHARLFINGNREIEQAIHPLPHTNDPIYVGRLPAGVHTLIRAPNVQAQSPPVEHEQKLTPFQGLIRNARLHSGDMTATIVRDVYNRVTINDAFKPEDRNSEPVERKPSIPTCPLSELCALANGQDTGVQWTPAMDLQLVDMLTAAAEAKLPKHSRQHAPQSVSLMQLNPVSLDLRPSHLAAYPLLSHLPLQALYDRLAVIQLINHKLSAVLPLVDFTQAQESWSLAYRLASISHLILHEVKAKAWQNVLRQTNTGGGKNIVVNRPRALKAKAKGETDGLKSVLGQIYRQLHFIRPSQLRTEGRPWRVTYEGEGGTDAGGVFRDSVSHICSEMQSDILPLFIPCPNSRGFGENQEKWVPNPGAKSSLQLSMFAFVGKLMGMAIRGGHVLNLDLPSLLWKPLVGQPITRADLVAIDSLCYDVMEKVANIDQQNVTEETFNDVITTNFVTTSCDGREVELKENGSNIPVTWHNRKEFVSLLEQYRLNEFKLQIEAIRRGLATIVPIPLLPLFTWQELEMMVCGKREIKIDYLRANTRYRSPVQESDPHIQMMWQVLESLSHDERQLFLRFVWGQSRLPYNPADFHQKFEITAAALDSDAALPCGHTCFFSLELPRYSKPEVMKSKILYAINNCRSIDTDYNAEQLNWDAE